MGPSAPLIGVLVVADIRLYRDGLADMVGRRPGMTVVGTAATGPEAVALARSLSPDVVLVDMVTPDALSMVGAISRAESSPRVVALAVPEIERDVIACAEAGVSSYVARDGSLRDLVAAIRAAVNGELLCSPRIAAQLFRRVAATWASERPNQLARGLTAREMQIAELLQDGLSNKEIARRLGIEVATVKNHVHRVLHKLNVKRRGEAAARVRSYAARQRTFFG